MSEAATESSTGFGKGKGGKSSRKQGGSGKNRAYHGYYRGDEEEYGNQEQNYYKNYTGNASWKYGKNTGGKFGDNSHEGDGSTDQKNHSKREKKLQHRRVATGVLEKKEIDKLKALYPAIVSSAIQSYKDMPLSKKTLRGLEDSEYTVPTKIQRESIPISLKGHDVLGAAKTGSGKTLAFVIPVLERLYCEQYTPLDGIGALVITPTRELAYQIFETFRKCGRYHDFSVGLIIGGKDLNFERRRLDKCNIMVCTPGRLLHHMNENPLMDSGNIKILVIDEADRCLDLGFEQTMNGIIENLPPVRQTLLFSATQTKSVKDLARLSLKNPFYVSVHEHSQAATPESLRQSYIITPIQSKVDVLWSFVKSHKGKKLLVFLTCCKQVRFFYTLFCRLRPGFSVLGLYGTMHQLKRMAVYDEFCRKESAVLLATDIAARGLDFPAVDWVVQVDCPEDPESYIHRAGRTARYNKDGESLLMLLPSEVAMADKLLAKRVPIAKIEVNPKMLHSIQRKLEAMLARDLELKQMAQRAFVTYVKAVFLMKDKSVFDVQQIDMNALARSLGLAIPPRVRFLKNREKLAIAQKNAAKSNEATQSNVNQPSACSSTVAEWRWKGLEASYDFQMDDEAESSESDEEDILQIKRKNHKLSGGEEEEEEVEEEEIIEKKKKTKILTKEKVAKRILAKKLVVNKKVVYDEDGNRIFDPQREKVSELARNLEMDAYTGEGGGIDLEEAKKMLQEEDRVDKEMFRQKIKAKHREQRLKRNAERRAALGIVEREQDEGSDRDSDESDGSVDEQTAAIIDDLPDPDKLYGDNDGEDNDYSDDEEDSRPRGIANTSDDDSDDSDDDQEVYRGPRVVPKRDIVNSSDDESDEEAYTQAPVARKRQQPDDEEEADDPAAKKAKKWVKKKPPKKVKPQKREKTYDDDDEVDLALDEELALHLLKSK